jgi:hypothetical protein
MPCESKEELPFWFKQRKFRVGELKLSVYRFYDAVEIVPLNRVELASLS